ncbi:hypothetical protein J3E64_001202 [Sphingobium sp. OAS761]|uniref:hypothetical protein n=1 Tax=Sphingobium sp. OAS761 TaxID=2817901 RepID=UPI00209F6100|nr:hypothetical protein [Sphingobium sp. OAS761]MCP1469527.1 hypothetical protein [Sphingobium sp. OAS761]
MTDPHLPDLGTKAGRKAFRHEMRMVAVRPRRWGLWFLTGGALLMILPSALDMHDIFGWSPSLLGIMLIAAALPLLVAGALLRRRYRRARLMPVRGDGPT